MTALLQAQNLGKSFRDHTVFRAVSFELHTGQHLALLGPSGCGKSTLLRMLAGLDAPTEGQLSLDGRLVSEPGRTLVPPHERKLALVFQDLALWPTLNALDNVLLGMARVPLTKTECRAQALEALRICKIETLAHRKPAALSVGQQQRVALARAMAVRPKLLLLDEPFSSLDLPLKQELIGELRDLADQFSITLLLVTHDPSEANALCSQALMLEDGRICERGTWAELMANPVSKTLRAARSARILGDGQNVG